MRKEKGAVGRPVSVTGGVQSSEGRIGGQRGLAQSGAGGVELTLEDRAKQRRDRLQALRRESEARAREKRREREEIERWGGESLTGLVFVRGGSDRACVCKGRV